MATNTIITKEFTYASPDAQYAQNSNLNLTGIYTGPSKWYVFINETNHLEYRAMKLTEEENGADLAAPEGLVKVIVDAETDPAIVSMIDPSAFTLSTSQSEVSETIVLADADSTEVTYSYIWPLPIVDIVDAESIVYNIDTSTWSYEFRTSQQTWDTIIETRNVLLENSDSRIADDMPDSLKAAWVAYRKKLRDLPKDWAGVDAFKVVYPTQPGQ